MRAFNDDLHYQRVRRRDPAFAARMDGMQAAIDKNRETVLKVADLLAKAKVALSRDLSPDRRARILHLSGVLAAGPSAAPTTPPPDTTPLELDLDAPVKLKDAIYLSELGGAITVDRRTWRPSSNVSVKALRLAVRRGALKTANRDGKNLFTTRRLVRAWMETWHDQATLTPSCSSGTSVAMPKAASRTKRSGSSSGKVASTSQAAARARFEKLRNS